MIIRLSGADFSANNIGTIQLIKEVTQETRDLLANYSREFTKTQMLAVQDFINGLKSEGIWSHIENLVIPALAGDVSEAFYPIKGNGVYNEYTTVYSLKNNGLYVASSDGSKIPAKIKVNGSYMNFHIASYLSYCSSSSSSEVTINSIYGQGVTIRERWMWNNNITIYFGDIHKTISNHASSINNTPTFLGVSSGTDDLFSVHNGTKNSSSSVLDSDTTITNIPFNVGADINNVTSSNIAQGLISTGSAMSSDMMLTYSNLVDTLMVSLLN